MKQIGILNYSSTRFISQRKATSSIISGIISRQSISTVKATKCIKLYNIGKRYNHNINESSWAAEDLKNQGETLDSTPKKPIFVDDAYYQNPSDKIKEIVTQILQLNVIEVHQLMNVLQVFYNHQIYHHIFIMYYIIIVE